MRTLLIFISITVFLGCNQKPPVVKTSLQISNTTSLLQAISILDETNIWISGHNGTYVNTKDGGKTWNASVMQDADTLQFRDIHAFNNQEVVLMSAGKGNQSQIRKTKDGGKSWEITFLMEDSLGFLNTIEFWDLQNGLAFGDAINGQLYLLKTKDGGDTWDRIDPKKLPDALGSEGGFAASGTCIAVQPGGLAWVGTGAGERPRVLHTSDYGQNWKQYANPIVSGEAAGITSVNFFNENEGVIVGGDLSITENYTYNVAFTLDGGKIWTLTGHPAFKGSIYGAGITTVQDIQFIFAAGPKGLEYTNDLGVKWDSLSNDNYWAVKFHESGNGWATGTAGKILKIEVQ